MAEARQKTKQPFAIAMKDGETYAFAGLWERWKDRNAGAELLTITVITTDPNEVVQQMHDRMPVIIPEHDYDRWLQPGDPDQPPIDLLRPFDAEKMTAWKANKAVGNVKNDTPDLLLPDNVVEMPKSLTEEEIRRWEDMDDLGVIDAMIERRLERKNKERAEARRPNLSFDF